MSFIQVSSSQQAIVLTKAVYYNNLPAAGTQLLSEGVLFLRAQGITWASAGLDCDQGEKSGGRKETGLRVLRGHRSVLGQGWPCPASRDTPGVPYLRAAVFLDPTGMRPVGDPNSLGSGEHREVRWVGRRPGLRSRGSTLGGKETKTGDGNT